MDEYRNLTRRPVALANGRPLAPGEAAPCDMNDPYDKALLDEGVLGRVTPVTKPKRKEKKR